MKRPAAQIQKFEVAFGANNLSCKSPLQGLFSSDMASLSGILSSTRLDSKMHGAGETCYQDLTTILEPGLENLLAFPLGASTDQRGRVNFNEFTDMQMNK